MKLYLGCPNCLRLIKVYTESNEVKEGGRITCPLCKKESDILDGPGGIYLKLAKDKKE